MLLVISVSTCGNFDFYHVFRLPVCVCVYNIFSETVDFLIQIIPFAAIVRLCVCVCVCVGGWQCFVGIEKRGGPNIFCSLCRSVLTLDLPMNFPWRNHLQERW